MGWFDRTPESDIENLEEEYPVVITPQFRMDKDRKKIVLINDLSRHNPLFCLTLGKTADYTSDANIFYHIFTGNDALLARTAFAQFARDADLEDCNSVVLIRKTNEYIHMYSNGYILMAQLSNQEKLKELLPQEYRSGTDVFIIPLKKYMHKCPVCFHRTLQYRNMFYICKECYWEDDGSIEGNPDSGHDTNGNYTIEEYRKWYLGEPR